MLGIDGRWVGAVWWWPWRHHLEKTAYTCALDRFPACVGVHDRCKRSHIPTRRVIPKGEKMSADPSEQSLAEAPSFHRSLDVRDLNCPLPILKTKAEFARMQAGQVLKVTHQQQQYVKELEMFSRQTGNEVIHTRAVGEHHSTWIRKK
jgi:tRNA 2-thiouridine synthesizing protein A